MNRRRWNPRVMMRGHRRALAGLSAAVVAMALAGGVAATVPPARRAARPAASSPHEAVDRMLTRIVRAPEIHSRVVIRRSDPFGGPDERTTGRIWFLPGRGLRFRSEERGGEEIVVDREKGSFLVFRSSEKVLYRAGWDRAPARMRQLITEPERVLDSGFQAVAERRLAGGALRDGYRVRRGALADSGSNVSVWIAADPATGLPRWVSAAVDEDSVEVEFRALAILSKANPRDLSLNLPRDVRTEPLDPRELLPGGESR